MESTTLNQKKEIEDILSNISKTEVIIAGSEGLGFETESAIYGLTRKTISLDKKGYDIYFADGKLKIYKSGD